MNEQSTEEIPFPEELEIVSSSSAPPKIEEEGSNELDLQNEIALRRFGSLKKKKSSSKVTSEK